MNDICNDNNEEFIKLYNELDAFIETKYDRYSDESNIYFLINKFRKSDLEIERDYSKKLDSIRKIRNLVVHESGIINTLFYVSNDVLETLKEIIKYVENPILAKDVMINFNKLYYARLETKIYELINIIYNQGVSNIPILNEFNIVIGVFNSDILLAIAYKNISLNKETKISDIKPFVLFNDLQNNRFEFVSLNDEIETLNELFLKSKEKFNKRLPMIFVTKNGKQLEPLQGVITPTDLLVY